MTNYKKILSRVARWRWPFICTVMLLCAISYFFDLVHPSAFYPSRLRLEKIDDVTPEEIIGEWKIELPNPNFLGPLYAIKGWRDARLVFYQNGECDLVSPTEEMMLDRSHYLTSQELIERKNCVGKTLQGHYKLDIADKKKRIRMNKPAVYVRIDCPPYDRAMSVKEDPRAERSDKYRILTECHDPGCLCGVLWRKCHDVPKLASRDAISGENSETEQVDTKESVGESNENR